MLWVFKRTISKRTPNTPAKKNEHQSFGFFSRLVGQSDPWSKKWWVIYWNDGPTADYIVKPVLSSHSRRPIIAYCRMLQGEHSAILSTFIKLPWFVIKIFFLSFFQWLLKQWFYLASLTALYGSHSQSKMAFIFPISCILALILPNFYDIFSQKWRERQLPKIPNKITVKTGFTVLTTYMYLLFCGICRLAVRWVFFIKVRFFKTK